jgi:flavin reductase (DIM6/NTAB) family NADH-FMN oxidoreductase RutF
MVAIGNRQDGTPKDTLRNIRNTKKATICVVNENYFEKMKSSAEPIPSHQSESEVFDIEVERVEHDFPPAIKGVESAMFCKLHSEIEFEGNTTPIFLEVVKHFVDDSSMIDESLKLNLIGRIGKTFAKVIEIE